MASKDLQYYRSNSQLDVDQTSREAPITKQQLCFTEDNLVGPEYFTSLNSSTIEFHSQVNATTIADKLFQQLDHREQIDAAS